MVPALNKFQTCIKLLVVQPKNLLFFLFLIFSIESKSMPPDTSINSLQKELIKQKTEYYRRQGKDQPFWKSLAAGLPTMLGTLLGATLALLGVRWSSNRQWQLERDKWEKAQQLERDKWEKTQANELIKEIRLASAELAKKIASALQAIMWLTWIGKFNTQALVEKDLDDYLSETKKLFNELVVAQAHLAALDPELYKKMLQLVAEVLTIDSTMTFAIQKFKDAGSKDDKLVAAKELGSFYDKASKFYESIPDKFSKILPSIN